MRLPPIFAIARLGGALCIAAGGAREGFHAYRADIEGTFFHILDAAPKFAARVRAGKREEVRRFVHGEADQSGDAPQEAPASAKRAGKSAERRIA